MGKKESHGEKGRVIKKGGVEKKIRRDQETRGSRGKEEVTGKSRGAKKKNKNPPNRHARERRGSSENKRTVV